MSFAVDIHASINKCRKLERKRGERERGRQTDRQNTTDGLTQTMGDKVSN